MTQPDLLPWRPAEEPSETPEKFKRAKGDPRDYAREWRAFVEAHPDIAAALLDRCRTALLAGALRIEINALFAWMRETYRVSANNSWRAAAADWACSHEPRLADLIVRRRRTVTK